MMTNRRCPVSIVIPDLSMPPAQTRSAFARGRTAYIFPDHAWFKHDLFGKPFHRFPDHAFRPPRTGVAMAAIDPITAGAVFIATAATDAISIVSWRINAGGKSSRSTSAPTGVTYAPMRWRFPDPSYPKYTKHALSHERSLIPTPTSRFQGRPSVRQSQTSSRRFL